MEAEAERLAAETIGADSINFVFAERLKIYSKLSLHIAKKYTPYIRESTHLRVLIPVMRDARTSNKQSYLGTGTIKKVQVIPGDFLIITLQIDVMDPYNRNHDQEVPHASTVYGSELSFRIIYDLDSIVSQKQKVRESNPLTNQDLKWQGLPYKVCFI